MKAYSHTRKDKDKELQMRRRKRLKKNRVAKHSRKVNRQRS